ncbi:tryptophan dehydrogenase ScyB [Moorena sp. SIO3B2]|uniref:tryptophan dehydrogenase ScyB n=1 Tax=Moorena sp. SIO3B2 TaxID=2607827 RepID=UPI0013CDBE73|nr:tryptophan dehydrogenase ScyB [Moorena sp. SIO3B2]NEP35315.1 tryptophan dehydrogenase ScyB [Moorena sp. SIO3B2]
MKLFETTTEMGHEQVLFYQDQKVDLRAIIALHDTSPGKAMGATRLWPYVCEEDALRDVLRLSRGMTYKAACANIPVGGGKGVIIANPQNKTDEMLKAYGRFVESLNGLFITGQDVNLSPKDVRTIQSETNYVVGVYEKSGGPAPLTARGVLLGIKAAVEFCWQTQRLDGLKVAVQGLGNVGQSLCKYLHQEGVELFVSDLNPNKTEIAKILYGAKVVEPSEIYSLDVDIFSPCALGGVLNSLTIPLIQAKIIAGAANNQLEDEQRHGQKIESRGIIYCPDYVINAGGLINVYNEMIGYEEEKAFEQLDNIYSTIQEILLLADEQKINTGEAARQLAEQRILEIKKSKFQLI